MRLLLPPLIGALRGLYAKATREFVIVSPWIKQRAMRLVVRGRIKKGLRLRVMTVGNLSDFVTSASDLDVFGWLLKERAEVRLYQRNLHA